MNVLDLFSGIGGFSLGLERAGMRTVAFCEINPFCREVLAKHWPGVPCHADVRAIPRIGGVDLVCGGFPCQPVSVAGKRQGKADDRHLWPAMLEVIQRERPAWVIGENVAGLISMGLDQVLADLAAEGYASRAFVIPACAVGANHQRNRVWIVANLDGQGLQERFLHAGVPSEARRLGDGQDIALDPWRSTEPAVVRAFYGIPRRVDRVRSLGNSVVPQIPEIIGRAIMKATSDLGSVK